jgi:creatinine amidohydrolase
MSKDPSCWLHELAWPEIEAHLKTSDVVLVPIGATEQHGPHLPPLEIAASKLRHRTGAQVAIADVGLIAKEEIDAICNSAPGGQDHAGESETAFMLAWRPELVDMTKAVTEIPERRSAFNEPMEFEPAYDGNSVSVIRTAADKPRLPGSTGVSGDARSATAGKGARIIDAIVANLVRLIEEIRQIPLGDIRAEIPY